jgi:thiamine biosynthesis protein ThiI
VRGLGWIRAVKWVVHYAELGLKGRNRPRFEKTLCENLVRALAPLGRAVARRLYGRILLEAPEGANPEDVAERLGRVFGVAYFSVATTLEPTREAITPRSTPSSRAQLRELRARAARRQGAAVPLEQLAGELGARILRAARASTSKTRSLVDLHLLHGWEAILLHERSRARGPARALVGRALRCLGRHRLAGGAWLLAKRGCEALLRALPQRAVHEQRVAAKGARRADPARRLDRAREALLCRSPSCSRRWCARPLRAAHRPVPPLHGPHRRGARERVAPGAGDRRQCRPGLVPNAREPRHDQPGGYPARAPTARQERQGRIIQLAKRIGTYEISIEPDEDCCSFLLPRQPATWTRPGPIEAIEQKLPVKMLVEATLSRVEQERIEPIS